MLGTGEMMMNNMWLWIGVVVLLLLLVWWWWGLAATDESYMQTQVPAVQLGHTPSMLEAKPLL